MELSARQAMRSTEATEAHDLEKIDRAEAMTWRALEILGRGGSGTYRDALAALGPGTQAWWAERLWRGRPLLASTTCSEGASR